MLGDTANKDHVESGGAATATGATYYVCEDCGHREKAHLYSWDRGWLRCPKCYGTMRRQELPSLEGCGISQER